MMNASVVLVAMSTAVCAAAVADARTRRIPNALTAALAAVALVSHAFDGIPTFADALLTMLAVFVAGTVLFAWGWFGGGDVKLLSACAGVVGSHHLLPFLLDVAIAGGLLALVEAARQRRLRTLFVSTAYAASGHRPAGALQLPYGIAIAAGALAYALPLLASPH